MAGVVLVILIVLGSLGYSALRRGTAGRESEHQSVSPAPAPAAPMDAAVGVSPPETVRELNQEAGQVAQALVASFPDRVEAFVVLAEVHLAAGRTAEAFDCWERCLSLDSGRGDVYLGMADLALLRGDPEEALTLAEKARQTDPGLPGAHNAMARALMMLGRTAEAREALEVEVQVAPDSSLSHYLLAQACLQTRDYEAAETHYRTAIRLQPTLWNAHYGLTTACARLGKSEEAARHRETFKELKARELERDIERSVAYDDLLNTRRAVAESLAKAGRVYHREGQPARAEALWKRAVEIDPQNLGGRENLGALYQSTGREREALAIYDQLRGLAPRNPIYLVNAGLVRVRLGEYAAAETDFRQAIALGPRQAAGYGALADLYLHRKQRLPEAARLAQQALSLQPSGRAYFRVGRARDMNGDRPGAIEAIRLAIELDPNNQEYRRIHALLQQKQ